MTKRSEGDEDRAVHASDVPPEPEKSPIPPRDTEPDGGDPDIGDPGLDDEDEEAKKPLPPPAIPSKIAGPVALAVTIMVALVLRFAFAPEQAGSWAMLIAMGAAYVPFAGVAIWALAKEGAIVTELRPKQGDLSFGAMVALLMYGATMAARSLVLGADSPRTWWLARIYLQLGDTSNNRMIYVGLTVLVIALVEEIVWRGLVMRSLVRLAGPLRGWLVSSFLYALAHATTVGLLAHKAAGPNPLLALAALGGGLVWGHLYNRTGRLGPSLFAHALFSWAIVDFPLWRPM